jgi:hypothetical protein
VKVAGESMLFKPFCCNCATQAGGRARSLLDIDGSLFSTQKAQIVLFDELMLDRDTFGCYRGGNIKGTQMVKVVIAAAFTALIASTAMAGGSWKLVNSQVSGGIIYCTYQLTGTTIQKVISGGAGCPQYIYE